MTWSYLKLISQAAPARRMAPKVNKARNWRKRFLRHSWKLKIPSFQWCLVRVTIPKSPNFSDWWIIVVNFSQNEFQEGDPNKTYSSNWFNPINLNQHHDYTSIIHITCHITMHIIRIPSPNHSTTMYHQFLIPRDPMCSNSQFNMCRLQVDV